MSARARVAARASMVAVTVTALTLLTAAPGSASETDNFGQHVRTCAQTMGFSGDHNPGMHHGAAGWDGAPCMGG